MLKEFKKFALRGNVVDMAVGIIIGAAFSNLISSLVKDVVMPPIGMLLGRVDFSKLAITIQHKTATKPEIVIQYGQFMNVLIDFLILSFVIFIVVRQMNKLMKKDKKEEASTKTCAFCYTEIPVKAMRCPNCTSAFE